MRVKVKAGGCCGRCRERYIVAKKKKKRKKNAQLDAATVSRGSGLPAAGEQLGKSEELLHRRRCGCVCVGKRKNDHVTSVVHPPGPHVCARRDKATATQDQLSFFKALRYNHTLGFPVIIPTLAASSVALLHR